MNIDQINQTLAAIGLSPLTEESILAYQRQPADDESRPFRRAIDGASEAYDAELNRLAGHAVPQRDLDLWAAAKA